MYLIQLKAILLQLILAISVIV